MLGSLVVLLAKVPLGNGFGQRDRSPRFTGHRRSHRHGILGGLAGHLGHRRHPRNVADARRSVTQLQLQAVHMGPYGSEFLLADETDSTDRPLNLGAHQANDEFAVGAALLHEVICDQLELFGDLIRGNRPGWQAVGEHVLSHFPSLCHAGLGNA